MKDHIKARTATLDRTAGASRWLIVIAIAIVALFASYSYAHARGAARSAAVPATAQSASAGGIAAPGSGSGGAAGCCGGAGPAGASGATGQAAGGCCGGATTGGPKVSKQADASGAVQKISIDLSSGSYDPSEVVLKAGVPAEITFGQGAGCLSQVQSQDLGFFEDLTGGPKTVKLPALTAGTYTFTCGMQMVSGTIVVK